MKAVIYARFSSEKQNEQSIEGQLRECYEYAKHNDITVIREYIDRAQSGTTDNRTAFQQMISDSAGHLFDAIIVYKMDRFARNRYDSAIYKARLKRNGVKLLYAKEHIPDGPEGILFESLLEGMAEYYSAELSQKLKRGIHETALKCKRLGGVPPLGYKVSPDGHYAIDDKTAPIVREIYARYAKGETAASICQSLNERGIKSSQGRTFTRASLPRILTNKKYIGIYTCKDVVIEGGVPAIVDKELFEAVQKFRTTNATHPVSHKSKADYLLSQKVFCGLCGSALQGTCGTSHDHKVFRYYRCALNRKGCRQKNIRKEYLERLVVEETVRRILQPDIIDLIATHCAELSAADAQNDEEATAIRLQIREKEKCIQNLLRAIEQGIITPSTKSRLEELEQQKSNLEYGLLSISNQRTPVLSKSDIKYLLTRFQRESKDISEEFDKDLVDCFIHKVFVYPDKIIISYNIAKNSSELLSSELPFDAGGSYTGCLGGLGQSVCEQIYWLRGYLLLTVFRD